ncbi:GspE/PulE family protein [Oligosphaera ethanolica]|uniref:Type IV pilus assembly protein PilB n=1 Tax=Oligosphaera ethanolica TaxID=760260 RepID=A0AAE3VG37_9BACT|nr:GspE/PulE family protein [Oligosphaera ethanolica]MDQ0289534.1 type IV pilus assembly protein PilB [Oligosphaera ethanolica]
MAAIDMDADVSMIWHLLLDAGIATEEQLEEAFDESQRMNRTFVNILFNFDIITEDDLLKLIAENLGTEVFIFKNKELDMNLVNTVPADMARFYGVIPVKEEGDVLWLVAKDPLSSQLTDELPFALGRDCRIMVGYPREIDEMLDVFYPEKSSTVKDIIEEMSSLRTDISGDDAESLEKAANEAPIVRFVNLILQQAIKDKASDIHFEPFSDEFRIRYRIDGSLYEMAPPPKHLAIPVISRIKVMSNLNIAERRIPQDGRIELRINKKPIDLRVSTLPTRYGESVVLRVLDRSVVNLSLDSLGMTEKTIADIRRLIAAPNGIFIVTGPTGSGKTTTLYSGLREINTIEDKLLTAEDPVEYDIEGIIQVPVREQVGMTFAAALRAFLRQDPDRIMVGEIRDVETASMAIQASLTGHMVLSTLHTNDAAGAVTRLIDMGIEPFLISSTLNGILAQRLLRRVCLDCREEYAPADAELKMLGLTREEVDNRPFYRGIGCDKCNNSGYKKRVGIFELLIISEPIQQLINSREPSQVIRQQAIADGMITLRRDGINQILNGITTAKEVLQYTV